MHPTAEGMNKLYEAIGSEYRVIDGQVITAEDFLPFIQFMWGVIRATQDKK